MISLNVLSNRPVMFSNKKFDLNNELPKTNQIKFRGYTIEKSKNSLNKWA